MRAARTSACASCGCHHRVKFSPVRPTPPAWGGHLQGTHHSSCLHQIRFETILSLGRKPKTERKLSNFSSQFLLRQYDLSYGCLKLAHSTAMAGVFTFMTWWTNLQEQPHLRRCVKSGCLQTPFWQPPLTRKEVKLSFNLDIQLMQHRHSWCVSATYWVFWWHRGDC